MLLFLFSCCKRNVYALCVVSNCLLYQLAEVIVSMAMNRHFIRGFNFLWISEPAVRLLPSGSWRRGSFQGIPDSILSGMERVQFYFILYSYEPERYYIYMMFKESKSKSNVFSYLFIYIYIYNIENSFDFDDVGRPKVKVECILSYPPRQVTFLLPNLTFNLYDILKINSFHVGIFHTRLAQYPIVNTRP